MLRWLVIIHVLGATIWVGGHLILAIRYLPKALQEKSTAPIVGFEHHYEALGLPALALQVITGIWMAHIYQVEWFSFETVHYAIINTKIILLLCTVLLAIHARAFIIPSLTPKKLPLLASHIILVTIIAVAMLYLGLSFRLGMG
ncbi:MAG: copper resistance protein CopD [Chlorobi bacterium CHB2]|nr:copper resistance protein CopD [Chlorobi bacterium CHB2]